MIPPKKHDATVKQSIWSRKITCILSYRVNIGTFLYKLHQVTHPEPVRVCSQKRLLVPQISCAAVVAERCVAVPEVEQGEQEVEVCQTRQDQTSIICLKTFQHSS